MTPVWTTSRAAGLAALMTSSLAISCGLLMAMKIPALRRRAPELRAAHQALANATFALIGVHAVSLLLDPVLRPGLAGLLVPFAAPYRPVATALGQIAAYGMFALGATFYIRRRVGTQRWRSAHRWLPRLLAARRGARPAGRDRRDDDVGAGRARAAGGRGRGAADDAALTEEAAAQPQ